MLDWAVFRAVRWVLDRWWAKAGLAVLAFVLLIEGLRWFWAKTIVWPQ